MMRLDMSSRLLTDGANRVRFTRHQAAVVVAICGAYPRAIAYDAIVPMVWPVDEPEETFNQIKVLVSGVRKKTLAAGMGPFIGTVWGAGFYALHPVEILIHTPAPVAIDPGLLEQIAGLLETHHDPRAARIAARLPLVG